MGIKEIMKKLMPKEAKEVSTEPRPIEPRPHKLSAEEVELNSYTREEERDNIRNETLKKRAERVGKLFGYENYGPNAEKFKIEKQQKLPCPGSKIRSEGQGRGLGFGKRKGPIGIPRKKKIPKPKWL